MNPSALRNIKVSLYKTGLWLCAITFIVFYLILSYHNRLASDDIYMLNRLNEIGLVNALFDFEFNKRLTSHALFYSIFIWSDNFQTHHIQLFIYHILLFSGFILATAYFLRTILSVLCKFFLSKKEAILYGILCVAALFFFTFQLNEAWFWTIASVIHLVPIFFFLAGIALLLAPINGIFAYILLAICFLYIGGGSESFALFTILILSIGIVNQVFFDGFKNIPNVLMKLLIAAAFTCLVFLFNVLTKGTTSRIILEASSDTSVYITTIRGFLDTFIQRKNLVFLQFLVLFFFIGNHFKHKGLNLPIQKLKYYLFVGILMIALSAIVTFFPLYYVFGSLGPQRSWSTFGVTIALFLVSVSFYVGSISKIVRRYLFMNILSLFITTSTLLYISRQYPMVKLYSDTYDNQIHSLIKLRQSGNTKSIRLKPLPDPGMLISNVLDTVPNGWNNQQLKRALNLNFEISLSTSD